MKNKINYPKNVSWNLLKDSMFVFEETSNKTHLLKGLSKDFWLSIQTTNDLSEIIENLAKNHNIELSIMESDINKIVARFMKNNLLIWS